MKMKSQRNKVQREVRSKAKNLASFLYIKKFNASVIKSKIGVYGQVLICAL